MPRSPCSASASGFTDTSSLPAADSVGIGCGQGGRGDYSDDLRYTYENDSQFAAFPTFPGVIMGGGRAAPKKKQDAAPAEPEPPRPALNGVKVNVDYERYMLKLKEVPPTGAELLSRSRLYGIHQRGRGVITENEREIVGEDGEVYYKIISGGYGIGGKLDGDDVGLTESSNITPPDRDPDAMDEM